MCNVGIYSRTGCIATFNCLEVSEEERKDITEAQFAKMGGWYTPKGENVLG